MTEIKATVSNPETARIGDIFSIQDAIDFVSSLGGGRIFIRNGTYLIDSDITLSDKVSLIGETENGVVIDFQNLPYGMRIESLDYYNTGTVQATGGSPNIVGTDTVWTSDMVGKYILLSGNWYTIATFTDSTHIAIDENYPEDDISGDSYVIATPINNVTISTLTIQKSKSYDAGLYSRFSSDLEINKVSVVDSDTGIKSSFSSLVIINQFNISGGENGLIIDTNGRSIIDQGFITNTNSASIVLSNIWKVSLTNWRVLNSGQNGLYAINASACIFNNFSLNYNSVNAIYLDSAVKECIFSNGNILSNSNDGLFINTDCDDNIISNIVFRSNDNYGMEISDATSSENLILGNIFESNGGGGTSSINDLGTNTLIRSNINAVDN